MKVTRWFGKLLATCTLIGLASCAGTDGAAGSADTTALSDDGVFADIAADTDAGTAADATADAATDANTADGNTADTTADDTTADDTTTAADTTAADTTADDTTAADTTAADAADDTGDPADTADDAGPAADTTADTTADAGTWPPGCCLVDGDCKNQLCAVPVAGAVGVCTDNSALKADECWTDAQCASGQCLGANICPCGALCIIADQPGTCAPPVNLCLTVKCGNPNPCTSTACDPATGACITTPLAAGTPCNDNDKCTADDHCDGSAKAVCVGGSLDPACVGGGACLVGGMGPAKPCAKEGEICQLPAGLCVGLGTCAKPPTICTKELNPVCGCDGVTYSNACLADAAGANIEAPGACKAVPAPGCCSADVGCAAGQVCFQGPFTAFKCMDVKALTPGQCWSDAQCDGGSCDGATACGCEANCKAMDKPGTCVKPDPCATMKCGDGNACTADSCDPATGKCVFKPLAAGTACSDGDACTLGDHCDGADSALCVAGKKDPACGGAPCLVGGMGPAKSCPVDGQFCKLPGGQCIGVGNCQPQPQVCTKQYEPVCGCDGVTYGNACMADAAGVGIVAKGSCKVLPQPGCCSADQGCEAGQACVIGPFSAYKCMSIKGLPAGGCWTDAQCDGAACVGASVCGCDANCKAADIPGVCAKPNPCMWMKCGDGNPCTSDSCDPATGTCVFTPDAAGTACNDGNACTGNDKCAVGKLGAQCVGTPIAGCGSNQYCSIGLGAPTIDCGAGGYCKLGLEWGCIGLGKCALKPDACPENYDPVCGCDGKTYGNTCGVAAAGENLSSQGVCVEPGCCKTDKDCKTGHCANAASGNGICKVSDGLGKGQCWTNADCGGATCTGTNICPCNAQCFVADKPGACPQPG